LTEPRTTSRQELFCGNSFLEEFDLAARVVGDRKNFVKLDLRVHAATLHDAVEPWPTIERLGVLDALPLVDAPGPPAFIPNEMFADQAPHVTEAGCDLMKVLAARPIVDVWRKFITLSFRILGSIILAQGGILSHLTRAVVHDAKLRARLPIWVLVV
jgi:hypothetical protein